MTKVIHKRSDIANPQYYAEHRTDILAAMRERGRPRLVNDVDSREAINTNNATDATIAQKDIESATNLYSPSRLQFTRSAIADMTPEEYKTNRSAILAAAKRKGGIIDDMQRPELGPMVTLYESEDAYDYAVRRANRLKAT